MKRAVLFVVGMPLLALAGCGASSQPTQTIVTVVKEVERSGTASTAPSDAATASRDTSVPNVVGERLDLAEEHLKERRLRYREIGGGTFGIIVRSNWTVCQQEPAPGSQTTARVNLIVDRAC